jgi:type III pantothenate kinase
LAISEHIPNEVQVTPKRCLRRSPSFTFSGRAVVLGSAMVLLFDIGNTHTHLGLARRRTIVRHSEFRTELWASGGADRALRGFLGRQPVECAALCSVVPAATREVRAWARGNGLGKPFELSARTLRGVGIDYPRPESIGPDRLANAVAVQHRFGGPAVVVDFGTAVTFDVIDARGNYSGGIIAPGLATMTDYLHEKTALLPRIKIRDIRAVVGKTTEEAMLIGAVHGYRGLIRELILELKKELGCRRLPVVATGGYARLISSKVGEITAVEPLLTLQGLLLARELAQLDA